MFSFIVSKPFMLPFVVHKETKDPLVSAKEIYESESLLSPLLVIDWESSKVMRVSPSEEGYVLEDNAESLLGMNTYRPERREEIPAKTEAKE